MNDHDLDQLDPTKKEKPDLARTFVRMPKPVKAAMRAKVKSLKPKRSLNAHIVHLCVEDLKKK
jgi:hypothetical protein